MLVPDFPQMLEVKKNYAQDYVNLYKQNNLQASDLIALFDPKKEIRTGVKPDLTSLNYDILAKQTVKFFETLLNNNR